VLYKMISAHGVRSAVTNNGPRLLVCSLAG